MGGDVMYEQQYHARGADLSPRPPAFGDYADNSSAWSCAVDHMKRGDRDTGLTILQALRAHIENTGDVQSLIYLLPAIQATLDHGGLPGESSVRRLPSARMSEQRPSAR